MENEQFGSSLNILPPGCWVVLLIMWTLIAVYVYADAEKNNMPPLVWAIIVFLFGLIGMLIYMAIKYSGGPARESGQYIPRSGGVYGAPPPGQDKMGRAEATKPDPYFRDDYLDNLIDDGKFSAARKYLREMIQMAREMSDEGGVRNYAQYEVKINKAAMDGTRRRRDH